MEMSLKCAKKAKNLIIFLITAEILIGFLPVFEPRSQEINPILSSENLNNLAIIEGNSLLPMTPIFGPKPKAVQKIKVMVTAYSSTPWETADDPFITAAGTKVREGIVANNLLPFGTKVRIPELFGERIFVVEDRMNSRKGPYCVDIWFPSHGEALNFGAKIAYLEILEN